MATKRLIIGKEREKKNACRILVGKPEGRRTLRR
jgi:hypothetical protein